MSKFLLNLLLQISQALENSKSNFYSKRILPPNSAHSAQPACPLPRPWPADWPNPPRPKPPSPLGLSAGQPAHASSVFYRRRFPLQFMPSRAGRLPLISLTTGPSGFPKLTRGSTNFSRSVRNPKIITKRSLASEKSTKIAPKPQNFISFQP
jgi:hypothetical protein